MMAPTVIQSMAAEAGADNGGVLWKIVDGYKPCQSGDADDEKRKRTCEDVRVEKFLELGFRGGLQPFSAPAL
jgi:hypothetical protein